MSDKNFDKKTLEYLAELSRIKLEKEEENGLLKSLQDILGYFDLLEDVNTENVEPLSGGTINKNVFRAEDIVSEGERLTEQFSDKEGNYLKIPPVFE